MANTSPNWLFLVCLTTVSPCAPALGTVLSLPNHTVIFGASRTPEFPPPFSGLCLWRSPSRARAEPSRVHPPLGVGQSALACARGTIRMIPLWIMFVGVSRAPARTAPGIQFGGVASSASSAPSLQSKQQPLGGRKTADPVGSTTPCRATPQEYLLRAQGGL